MVCEGASTFVTRDGTHLTKLNDAMHERYGLRLTPGRLVADFDQLADPDSYAPASLGGDNRAKGFKRLLSGIVQSFLRNDRGETKRRFWKSVDASLSVKRGSS